MQQAGLAMDNGSMNSGSSGSGRWFAAYFGVLGEPRTYRNLLYLILGLPLGIAYFTILVTLISLAGGMAVTIVGLPLAVLTLYGWCELARIERLQANALAGTHIPPLAFPETGNPIGWSRIKQRLRNGLTWRSLAFLFLRFPHGIATFVIAVTAVSVPAFLIGMPAIAEWGGNDGGNLGFWQVDSFWEGAIFVLPGILLLPAAAYLTNALARVSGRLTEQFLGSEGAPPAAIDRVATAAFTWHGVGAAPAKTPAAARRLRIQLRIFAAHAAFFVALSLLLLFINGRVSGGHWWAVYPIWGLAIPLAMHAGYLLRGFLGLHAGLYAIVNLGLFVIDLGHTGGTWFFYPLLGWGLLLALHWSLARRMGTGQPSAAGYAGSGQVSAAGDAPGSEPGPGSEGQVVAPPASPISVDVVMRTVRVDGQLVELTPKEFDLLVLFAQNPGRPFSRDELLDRIWKNEYEVTDRTVDTHVQRLRKKLGQHADAIQTVWGVGYRFQAANG